MKIDGKGFDYAVTGSNVIDDHLVI